MSKAEKKIKLTKRLEQRTVSCEIFLIGKAGLQMSPSDAAEQVPNCRPSEGFQSKTFPCSLLWVAKLCRSGCYSQLLLHEWNLLLTVKRKSENQGMDAPPNSTTHGREMKTVML